MDRITYALIGAIFGAAIGTACWFLYGLVFSLRYSGPGIDPNLRHWAAAFSGLFGILGLLFKERVGAMIGDAVSSIFDFEAGTDENVHLQWWQVFIVAALIVGVVWYVMS